MAVSKSVRRLLRVLQLEEDMRRRELESAQADLARLDLALIASCERVRDGRILFTSGVQHAELSDRLAGDAEVQAGKRRGAVLQQRIEQSRLLVGELRRAFLEKRVERKQAETLVKVGDAQAALEEGRKTQQSLDSWYLMRPSANKVDSRHIEHETGVKTGADDRTHR